MGRKLKFGEPTKTWTVRIPESIYNETKDFINKYLKKDDSKKTVEITENTIIFTFRNKKYNQTELTKLFTKLLRLKEELEKRKETDTRRELFKSLNEVFQFLRKILAIKVKF